MIGCLKGIILEKQAPEILIDVQGVGYEVQLPITNFSALPDIGKEALVYTHFNVREDAQLLFGFTQKQDRSLFKALIKINGVGPKLALAILSGMNTQEFIDCVAQDNIAALTRLPGVGKKTAERLLIEMRDKLKSLHLDATSMVSMQQETLIKPALNSEKDAVLALVSLGYKPQQASKVVKQVYQDDMSSEQLIKSALQAM
tara:strand:- start:7097 stop:7699 length:603 start_codon:yes stop_codon:yes gene_type:complete